MVANPAWLLHRLVALSMLAAWASLASQVRLLIGSDGLLPVGDLVETARASTAIGFWQLPSLVWWLHSDGWLVAGTVLGAALSASALAGCAPRLCLALGAPLYLSYAVAGQSFLGFQWDSLAVELSLLAALLPADNRDPVARWLLRLLLFKLMFESGVAKWQSHLGDWQDGSAMTVYYQTAPIPTALAWIAHHLPDGWHRFEAWWTLFFELVVPFFIFLGRWPRRIAAAIFIAFLVVDTATANYGFFTLQAAALCVLLFDGDGDADRPAPDRRRQAAAAALGAVWIGLSVLGGLSRFAEIDLLPAVQEAARPLRVANNYHLFGHITRQRIEPEFQTLDGAEWTAQHLWYKPGPLDRPPPLVAPHQPRVDFQLWFYGLSFRRGMPRYVEALLSRLCNQPGAVQPLFSKPLPTQPQAVRIVFWEYTFTSPGSAPGEWWLRAEVARTKALPCAKMP